MFSKNLNFQEHNIKQNYPENP